jgi:hypothetical protein
MLGKQNVPCIAAFHHAPRDIQTGTGEIAATSNINNSAYRATVNAHTQVQLWMTFERAAQLHRAANRRFRAGVKHQGHAVARGDFD